MAVKKTLVLLFLVILIFSFSFSAFASSIPDFSDALVYAEDIIALGEIYLYPPLFIPVDGEFYRLYALDSSNNTVIVDVIAQCNNGSIVDPVSGCEYLYVSGDEVCVFWFPMFADSQEVSAKCALFASSAPDVPVDNSVTAGLYSVIGILGIILRSFSPSGPLFPLMVLLVLGISVSFLIYSVYVIRKFVWGD